MQDPGCARKSLLQAVFREIYRSGFQNAAVDAILAITGVTKGALYYHVDNKEALGFAVIEEVIVGFTQGKWLRFCVEVRIRSKR